MANLMHCEIVCPTGAYLLKTPLCIKPVLDFFFFLFLGISLRIIHLMHYESEQ